MRGLIFLQDVFTPLNCAVVKIGTKELKFLPVQMNLRSTVVKSLFLFRSRTLLLPLFLSPPQPVKRLEVKRALPDV